MSLLSVSWKETSFFCFLSINTCVVLKEPKQMMNNLQSHGMNHYSKYSTCGCSSSEYLLPFIVGVTVCKVSLAGYLEWCLWHIATHLLLCNCCRATVVIQLAVSGANIQSGGQTTQHTWISYTQEAGGRTASLGPASAESKSGLQASTRLQVC